MKIITYHGNICTVARVERRGGDRLIIVGMRISKLYNSKGLAETLTAEDLKKISMTDIVNDIERAARGGRVA